MCEKFALWMEKEFHMNNMGELNFFFRLINHSKRGSSSAKQHTLRTLKKIELMETKYMPTTTSSSIMLDLDEQGS